MGNSRDRPALVLGTQIGCGTGGQSDTIVRVSRQNNSGTYAYFREVVLGDKEYKLGSYRSERIERRGRAGLQDAQRDWLQRDGICHGPGEDAERGAGSAVLRRYRRRRTMRPMVPILWPEGCTSTSWVSPTGAIKHYLDWIRSPEGQAIVDEIGYVPVEPVEMTDNSPPPEGTIKVAGSDTMVNLAQAWAEDYGKKYGNVGRRSGFRRWIGSGHCQADRRHDRHGERQPRNEAGGAGCGQSACRRQGSQGIHGGAGCTGGLRPQGQSAEFDYARSSWREIYGENGTIERWSQVEGWSAMATPDARRSPAGSSGPRERRSRMLCTSWRT